MNRTMGTWMAGLTVVVASTSAEAHIEVASGPGFAGTTQEISFAVEHGCSGLDTSAVRIEIPSAVTSVRAETSDFGKATVEKDATGLVTAVSWQKPDADLLDSDTDFYKLTLRIKVPNQPFTQLFFPAHQTCRGADAGDTVVDWIATTPSDAGVEPAPALSIVPPRLPGWNMFTVPQAIGDLSVFFSDAVIVWKDSAAYSVNPNTTASIAATSGVTPLTSLAASDIIWVKY